MKNLTMILVAAGVVVAAAGSVAEESVVSKKASEEWLKGARFDKTYVRHDGVELLNGYNPANEFWCMSGGKSGTLDGEDKKVSFRFTDQHGKTVTHVEVWPKYLHGKPFEIRTGLQEDKGGKPGGKWLGSGTFTPATATRPELYSKSGWRAVDSVRVKLDRPVKLEMGKVYHVVTQYESGKADKKNKVWLVGVGNFKLDFKPDGTQGTPIHCPFIPRSYHGDTNVNFHDPALMSLQFDGRKWRKNRREIPFFLVIFSDGTTEGQPCVHWRLDMWGKKRGGELIRIKQVDKEVMQIGVPLRKHGDVQDGVHYEIRDSKEKVLREGLLVKAKDLQDIFRGGNFVWCYADFKPLVLKKGRAYRIVISSPGTNRVGNPNRAIGTDVAGYFKKPDTKALPAYARSTYDGTNSVYTFSRDGGKTWEEHPNRDMSFRLKLRETLSGSVTSTAKDAEKVSGAGAKWHSVELEGKIPAKTSVDIFISSSDDGAAWSDFVQVKPAARSRESCALPAGHRKRYMKWRLALRTGDAKITPKVTRVSARTASGKK